MPRGEFIAAHLGHLLSPISLNMYVDSDSDQKSASYTARNNSSLHHAGLSFPASSLSTKQLPLTALSTLVPPLQLPSTEPLPGEIPLTSPRVPGVRALFESAESPGNSVSSGYARTEVPPISTSRFSLPPLPSLCSGSEIFAFSPPLPDLSTVWRERTSIPRLTQSNSFRTMVLDIIRHNSFPLILKKACEILASSEVPLPEFTSYLSNADWNMKTLSNFARSIRVEGGASRSSSLDTFMMAFVAAMDELKNGIPIESLPNTLHGTLVACKRHADLSQSHSNISASTQVDSIRPRPKLSKSTRSILEQWFNEHYDNPYPSEAEKLKLARKCQISLNQVNNFFGNKRMRIKRKAMAMAIPQTQGVTTRHRKEPVFDVSAVLAPCSKWRAIVLSKVPYPDHVPAPRSSPPVSKPTEVQLVSIGEHTGPQAYEPNDTVLDPAVRE